MPRPLLNVYILVPIIINLGLHDKNTYISEREDEESPVKQWMSVFEEGET